MPSRWQCWIERLPIATDRPALGYVFGAAAIGVAGLVRYLAAGLLPHGYPFVTFFPAVVVTAFVFGVGPGIFAGVASGAIALYFFVDPVSSFFFDIGVRAVMLFYVLIISVNLAIIHLLQRTNAELRIQREYANQRRAQGDLMFHELQHRISNKLQIIASLLTLQRRTVTDRDAQKALEEAARRVGMVGRISRSLHDPDRAGLGVGPFLDQVGRDILESAGVEHVSLHVDVEPDLEFTSDSGVPIALILCETISNALEHGIGARGHGAINIVVRRDGREVHLVVTDDGEGVPAGFDATASPSLGLRIATTLARQLEGSYNLRPGPNGGTIAELRVVA